MSCRTEASNFKEGGVGGGGCKLKNLIRAVFAIATRLRLLQSIMMRMTSEGRHALARDDTNVLVCGGGSEGRGKSSPAKLS